MSGPTYQPKNLAFVLRNLGEILLLVLKSYDVILDWMDLVRNEKKDIDRETTSHSRATIQVGDCGIASQFSDGGCYLRSSPLLKHTVLHTWLVDCTGNGHLYSKQTQITHEVRRFINRQESDRHKSLLCIGKQTARDFWHRT